MYTGEMCHLNPLKMKIKIEINHTGAESPVEICIHEARKDFIYAIKHA